MVITAQAAGKTGRAKVAMSKTRAHGVNKKRCRLDRGDLLVGNTGEMGKLTESQVSLGQPELGALCALPIRQLINYGSNW